MRYEYAVLVTSTSYEILALAQPYRDRADAENTFDELKNQCGWGGFTTQDLARCRLMARMVALVDAVRAARPAPQTLRGDLASPAVAAWRRYAHPPRRAHTSDDHQPARQAGNDPRRPDQRGGIPADPQSDCGAVD
jgi:hypothetical protein